MAKWTQDIRRVVYKRLMKEFGPCSEWKSRTNPTGDSKKWWKILNDIAIGLTSLTGHKFTSNEFKKNGERQEIGSAVASQIQWGIQKIQQSCVNTGAVKNFVLNRAIALEIGLIDSTDMPNCAEFGFKTN